MSGCRKFTITINPSLSGALCVEIGDDKYDQKTIFGYDYDEPGTTLSECIGAEGDGPREQFQRVAAGVALDWVRANPENIFPVITNLIDGEDVLDTSRISVEGVDFIDGKLVFKFAETTPGDLISSNLDGLVEEIQAGGDTWDCGDFGNLNMDETGFDEDRSFTEAAWIEKFGALATSDSKSFDPKTVKLRLSMCDGNAAWSLAE